MKYRVQVLEHYFKDNYQDGEVQGTYNIVELGQAVRDTLSEAIAWARELVEHQVSPDSGYGDIIGDGVICLGGRTAAVEKDYFRAPTAREIEDWKAGKIDLWSEDFQAVLTEERAVDNDDLEAAAKAAAAE